MESRLSDRDLAILKVQSIAADHLVHRLTPGTPEEKEAVRRLRDALKKINQVVGRIEKATWKGISTRD